MEFVLVRKVLENSLSSESESSDSDNEALMLILSEKRRKFHIKNSKYVSDVVSKYLDTDFKQHFRLSRVAVENLLLDLKTEEISIAGRPGVPAKDCLLLTIWVLSNQESFRSVADRFGFNKGHAHSIFMRTCLLLCANTKKYIVWPTGQEAIRNVEAFNALRDKSFPNVFGCVDGTHIAIPGPMKDNSYYNRKGYHSVLLQGICNSKMEFIDVYCGWPGSVNDARMWDHSPVNRKLQENPRSLLPSNTYLLGDSAYPLREFLMVPFRDNGHLTADQKNFNKILSSTRVVVEQAFGRLKGMFRRLKYLNISNLKHAKYILFSSCILHNIVLKDSPDSDEDFDSDDTEENEIDNELVADVSADNLRNDIMNSLCD